MVQEYDASYNLWQSDNSHANIKGSYLAACVFYYSIFQKSPYGSSFYSTISSDSAIFLQHIADSVFLGHSDTWINDNYLPKADFEYEIIEDYVYFSNTSLNSLFYIWTFGDGESSNLENQVHRYTTSGTFDIKLISSNDCYTDTLERRIYVSCSEINEKNGEDFTYFIYPNPTTSVISIYNRNKQNFQYEILDINGRILEKGSANSTRCISLETYQSGIYLLNLSSSECKIAKKITAKLVIIKD